MNKLNIARVLIVIGMVVGWESLYQSFHHIGDPLFLISPDHPGGDTHAWYHVLRELMGDIGTIIAVLVVFFAGTCFRTPATWWLSLIVLVGYYSPFWVGMPFNPALAAPTWDAEIRHIIQAAVPLAGLFLARAEFYKTPNIQGDLTQ